MNYSVAAMFLPLKKKESLKIFFVSAIIIAIIYIVFSIVTSLLTIKPFPQGNIFFVVLFAAFRSFSTFTNLDWIILALFPLVGGLLFANYSYWKCATSKTAKTGLAFGLVAAVCPACILPILGISSVIVFVTKISLYLKLGALALLLGSTFYVANRKSGNICK